MSRNLVLPSLRVEGFRAFGRLEIEPLGRVNLIVGRNGVGKSSVLEAVRLYATQGYPSVLQEILEARDETKRANPELLHADADSDPLVGVQYLFHGYPALSPDAAPIRIGPTASAEAQLEVSVHLYREERDEQGYSRLVEAGNGEASDSVVPGLGIAFGDKLRIVRLDDLRRLRRRFAPRSQRADFACVQVSPRGPDDLNPIGKLWDSIALTERESDVIDGLRIVMPEVERVSLVGEEERSRGRFAVAKLKHRGEPLPLRSLGGGVSRVFEIVLALVNAKGGVLLIDEVENGLHYSVQAELWRAIIRLAGRLGVQVFTTSHSWDCIEAFQEAGRDCSEEDAVLIRLTRHGDEVAATTFAEEELGVVTRDQIEVR